MDNIIITDSSLRDGNHSVKHTISLESIKKYCEFANASNIPIVEVGHGNGLGASSLLIGKSTHTDKEIIETAKKYLTNSKLGVHIIPGIATVDKDIRPALEMGVEVFRIATHCTEATLSKSHIEYLKDKDVTVLGVLMMTALTDIKTLVENAKIMESYGADGIIIMDSTGTYLPADVEERIQALVSGLSIDVGFHAHNNLGCAVANSLVAAQNGAKYIDACIRGFGAGAGNAPLEVLLPVLEKSNFNTGIDFKQVIIEADKVEDYLVPSPPTISPVNVLTGLNKLFSGFERPIIEASKLNGIEYSSLIFELGNRKLVAGQEDLILEIAQNLKNK
jgi:4-hydroxy 2-oxovalerate aldolase|tara:strand:- start:294 stop:1295 length:1002 start_codon:yes stop_codon:yes gene_type:complete